MLTGLSYSDSAKLILDHIPASIDLAIDSTRVGGKWEDHIGRRSDLKSRLPGCSNRFMCLHKDHEIKSLGWSNVE